MRQYSIESRARKYIKGYGFLSFARKYTVMGYWTRFFKNCFQKSQVNR